MSAMKLLRVTGGSLALLAATLLLSIGNIPAAEASAPDPIHLSSPVDFQVIQRATHTGTLIVAGTLPKPADRALHLEAKLIGVGATVDWQTLSELPPGAAEFRAEMKVPEGGWYRLEVRAKYGDTVAAEAVVEHVGVGEIFLIAGQSNSANHGEERQATRTGRVAAFNNGKWQLAKDPQPGASGSGGSFMPPFGDAIAERFNVPVGIVAAGVGATSVREWLPAGTRFPHPPTLTGNVTQLPDGEWESKGTLFTGLTRRMKQFGPHGFRAVLWHQGESDANQPDPSRTLPGELYRQFLAQLIRDSRREAGWDVPWYVAQVSYNTPGRATSPDIRAAQADLWKSGLALEGPDTDALTGDFRDGSGAGVHFSGKGLREHGIRWAAKVAPWLERQLVNTSKP